jgi:hypothetical protein
MIISKYCIISILLAVFFIGSVFTGLCADERNPSTLKTMPEKDLSPEASPPPISEKKQFPLKMAPSYESNTLREQNTQSKICSDLLHNAKTTIDLMRQNCASNSPRRNAFTLHVQNLETHILNWKNNKCAESTLSPAQKREHNTLISLQFSEIEGMCINKCWNTLQGHIHQGSLNLFLHECGECCGFYPLDNVQRCRDECSRTEEKTKEVEKDIDELIEQLSKGIAAIMKMLDNAVRTNNSLTP